MSITTLGLSKDTYPINANGTAFIEFCKASGYGIMNGRVDQNNSSNFTCFANRGNSVVDYALIRQENFSMVDKMSVSYVSFQIIAKFRYLLKARILSINHKRNLMHHW